MGYASVTAACVIVFIQSLPHLRRRLTARRRRCRRRRKSFGEKGAAGGEKERRAAKRHARVFARSFLRSGTHTVSACGNTARAHNKASERKFGARLRRVTHLERFDSLRTTLLSYYARESPPAPSRGQAPRQTVVAIGDRSSRGARESAEKLETSVRAC